MAEEYVEKIGRVTSGEQEEPKKIQRVPDKEQFDGLMKEGVALETPNVIEQNAEKMTVPSLMDEVRNANDGGRVYTQTSAEGLISQTQDVINKIDNLKRDLATPNLELKGSVQNLLQNKLEHIDENLQIALNKVGGEYTSPGDLTKVATPIERFLGLLTHGQHHLDRLANDVRSLHLNGEDINPASLLAVQVKVTYVQQELEFFTSLLNKALESTKTIMNVQV